MATEILFHRCLRTKGAKGNIQSLIISSSDPGSYSQLLHVLIHVPPTGASDLSMVDRVVQPSVSDVANQQLIREPTLDEVRAVVFDLSKDSAPGPDGWGLRLNRLLNLTRWKRSLLVLGHI